MKAALDAFGMLYRVVLALDFLLTIEIYGFVQYALAMLHLGPIETRCLGPNLDKGTIPQWVVLRHQPLARTLD